MKTLLRALILLLLVLWLGGVMFFPVVAASAFGTTTDTHLAGTIVRKSLLALHYEGLFAGSLLVVLLLIAQATRALCRKVGGASRSHTHHAGSDGVFAVLDYSEDGGLPDGRRRRNRCRRSRRSESRGVQQAARGLDKS